MSERTSEEDVPLGALLPPGVRVSRVRSDPARCRAAQRLVEHSRPGDRDAGRLFLANTRAAGIDLEHFFASFPDESGSEHSGTQPSMRFRRRTDEDSHPPARESLLIVLGSGRTALLFPSMPESSDRERELGSVVVRGIEGLPSERNDGPALAQALLLRSEAASGRGLEHAGFTKLAELAYLRKTPLRTSERFESYRDGLVEGVTVKRLIDIEDSERDQTLTQALEASYKDTLDCPELQSLRETSDVLVSHKATGVFDPTLWWVLFKDNEPAGVTLVSALEERSEAELVYMGLGRSLRGHGLGKRMLGLAIDELRKRGTGSLTCAVDLRNTPAMKLYSSLGLRAFAERVAYVLDLRNSS